MLGPKRLPKFVVIIGGRREVKLAFPVLLVNVIEFGA